jgi:hypothetical protein
MMQGTGGREFADLSWATIGPEGYVSRFDRDFPQREALAYYDGPPVARLDDALMPRAYEWLRGTNFPTLYASVAPAEDFAESFANYIHTRVLRRPYEVRLTQGERVVLRLGACWSEPRCAAKRRVLEALLERWGVRAP